MPLHHLLFAVAYVGLIFTIWVFIAKEMELKMARTLEFLRGVIIKAIALLLAVGWAASMMDRPEDSIYHAKSALRNAVQMLKGTDKNLSVGDRGR